MQIKDDSELDAIFFSKVKISDINSCNIIKRGYPDFFLRAWRAYEFYKLGILYFSKNMAERIFCRFILLILAVFERFLRRSREFIITHSGCNNACSYCAIRCGIGRVKSKTIEEIIREVKTGIEYGYKYFKLSSNGFGQYGQDINVSSGQLLDKLISLEDDFVMNIVYLNPEWLISNFSLLYRAIGRGRVDILSLTLQSGSSRILKLMKRNYDADILKKYLKILNSDFRNLQLRTEVMVGFPSEGPEDFQQTMDFLREVRFSDFKCNIYSDRPKTESANYIEKIPLDIKVARYRLIERRRVISKVKFIFWARL